MKKDKLKGGKADNMSKKDIADKFGVALSKIDHELDMGKKIEMEHVNSTAKAKEIAMDHLVEIPDYYTRLKKMEKEGERKWSKKNMNESVKEYFKRVLKEDVELSVTDETPVTTDYDIIYNGKRAGILSLGSFNKSLPEKSVELVLIQIAEDYRGLKIGKEVIKNIWAINPDINRIYLMPTTQSRGFWSKMGATRVNDTYSVIFKSH